jgi:hypothetical protein
MARPTIDHLFDHTVRVWRPTSSKGRLGQEERTYAHVINGRAALNRAVDPVAPVAAGLAPTGRIRIYLRPDANVQERDVIQIVTGPDAPGTWEIDQPPTRPRGHHTQVDAIAWHGVLPEYEPS